MKFLFDFFPILLFFIAYKVYGIYVATAVAIVAAVVQTGWFWFKHRRFETMHLVTLALIAVLGGLTLWLQDESFIKWKVTLVNWAFAVAFLGSIFIGEKPLVQRMMEQAVDMPRSGWLKLNYAWVAFFTVLGLLNIYVMYNFDTDTWVDFKLFGLMGLTFAFVIAQAFFLARYIKPEEETEGEH